MCVLPTTSVLHPMSTRRKKHGHGVGLISVRQYTMLTTLLDHRRRQFYSVAAVFDGRIEFPHNMGFSHS